MPRSIFYHLSFLEPCEIQISYQLRNFHYWLPLLVYPPPPSRCLSISWFMSVFLHRALRCLSLIFQDTNLDINRDHFLLHLLKFLYQNLFWSQKISVCVCARVSMSVCCTYSSSFLILLVQGIYANSYFCSEGSVVILLPGCWALHGSFFSLVCSFRLCPMYWGILSGSIPKVVEGTVVSTSPGHSLAADRLPVLPWSTRRKPFLVFSPLQLRVGSNSTHLLSCSGTRETRYTPKDLPHPQHPLSGWWHLTNIPGTVCLLQAPAAALLRRGRWVKLQVEKMHSALRLLIFLEPPVPHSSCVRTSSLFVYSLISKCSMTITE